MLLAVGASFSGGSTGGGEGGDPPPRRPPAPKKTATPTVFLLRTKRAFFIFVLVKHSRSFNSSSSPHTMPPQLICRCVSSVTLTLLCVLHSTNWLPPVHNYLLIAVTGSHVMTWMGEERLTGLALLNIHRDIPVDAESVIERFAKRKNRLLDFVLW